MMIKGNGLKIIILLLITVGILFTINSPKILSATTTTASIYHLTLNGVIGPASEDYIKRALETAIQHKTQLVILELDTPGGLDSAMRGIIKSIINSPIPVVTYVAPSGARAASAGTYILYASHIAAMAPGTNLGAATPVQIGAVPIPEKKNSEKSEQNSSKVLDDPMKHKVINDAVAYIRSLAELHGRNQHWAEQAVRFAASLPATEALKNNVIDIIATDIKHLLQQIDGREVLVDGKKHTIEISGLVIEKLDPDWRSQFLSVITNPNIAYILMLVGIYGLIFEFSNPGAILPGTVGAICLLLALFSFQLLPINYAGVGLILLGVALMVGEAFQPSFGILGVGGIVSFVFGSIILIDTDEPDFVIDIWVIMTFTVLSIFIFIIIIGLAIKSRHRKVVSGIEQLIGAQAKVLNDFTGSGRVLVHSENWQAQCDTLVKKDQLVRVIKVDGLILQVESNSTLEEKS